MKQIMKTFAVLFMLSHSVFAADFDGLAITARAELLCSQNPDAAHIMALAEIRRAHGQADAAQRGLIQSLETTPKNGTDLSTVHALLCWRSMPVGIADVPAFAEHVKAFEAYESAKHEPHPWLAIFRLYLDAIHSDRASMLAHLERISAPAEFPNAEAERAHFEVEVAAGFSNLRAATEVITHRAFEPMHGLLELDHALTRQYEFFRASNADSDAKKIEVCRDRLRDAYLKASRNIVERLFALKLLGKSDERDRLVKQAQYLNHNDIESRIQSFATSEYAWRECIQPWLTQEADYAARQIHAESDAADHSPAMPQIWVTADKKPAAYQYEGSVRATLGLLEIECNRLNIVADKYGTCKKASANGNVKLSGLRGMESPVFSDTLEYDTNTGLFSLAGNVRIPKDTGSQKLLRCEIDRSGKVQNSWSLLDDFHLASNIDARIALLPFIIKTYSDDELNDETRYVLALSLLRPHLSWHGPYLPPLYADETQALRARQLHDDTSNDWQEANQGEEWMPEKSIREKLLKELEREQEVRIEKSKPGKRWLAEKLDVSRYFWRIEDLNHSDVVRAGKLLEAISEASLAPRAKHWLRDIRRNNTVITFDITGGYAANIDAPVVMDVRAAEKVSLELYRVQNPEEFLKVTSRIGTDYIYRDYGLQWEQREELAQLAHQIGNETEHREQIVQTPVLDKRDLVSAWDCRPGDLTAIHTSMERDWDFGEDGEESDSVYFGDRCDAYEERLQKRYAENGDSLSTWQCNRVLKIPGKSLNRPGAYILVAEANGQRAFAPIIVEPLSLVLRRCRDGVFAMVEDNQGKLPAAGARLLANGMLAEATADDHGVAFLRVFAAGDRAIVACQGERYAIGGFGRVFEGIYHGPWDFPRYWRNEIAVRERQYAASANQAQVYTDRHIIAAYTDRPVYRPGQEVHFKMIVRRIGKVSKNTGHPGEFRANDFDYSGMLELPPELTEVNYDVLSPKGSNVGSGTLKLNDFGTAAGNLELSSAEATGSYSLRVVIGGIAHIVPHVFQVKYYRRPNFEIKVDGAPARLKADGILKLDISGQYFFGGPVLKGRAEAHLVVSGEGSSLASANADLDQNGRANLELKPTNTLTASPHSIICVLTDESGQAVTKSIVCDVDTADTVAQGSLSRVPRFFAVDEVIEIETAEKSIESRQRLQLDDKKEKVITHLFSAAGGRAQVHIPEPGWHTLTAGNQTIRVFVYGGHASPWAGEPPQGNSGWVNLTSYASEESGERPSRDEYDLQVLFESHDVKVGTPLHVLCYTRSLKDRILFTIEGQTVMDYYVSEPDTVKGSGNYRVVEIPIKDRYQPHFYLQGRIVDSGGVDVLQKAESEGLTKLADQAKELEQAGENPRWCRVDVSSSNNHTAVDKLKISLETDRKAYKPGDEVQVHMHVAGLDGAPRNAEVSLAAIDESLFAGCGAVTSSLAQVFADPRPDQYFIPKTWRGSLGAAHSDLKVMRALEKLEQMQARQFAMDAAQKLVDVARLPALESFGEMPASTIDWAPARSDFRETAAWQPQLSSDKNGEIHTSFKLPQSLTAFRLNAVGITRETETGNAYATVHATLPLAVQVFLPRFAVVHDRLQAVGLIHNNGTVERECRFEWSISGAKIENVDGNSYQVVEQDGESKCSGLVQVPASSSVRVAIGVNVNEAPQVKALFRTADNNVADTEARTIPVYPLGRSRDVAINGSFARQSQIALPSGFAPGEIRINFTRGKIPSAIQGLASLIDYPYGCVEQTMSRFLPAVMVENAARLTPIDLPDEIERKLPDVLKKGLARLYYFQHADGGWGWWEHDDTNRQISVYVLYGLGHCKKSGVQVNSEVLRRACEYVRLQLRSGTMAGLSAELSHGAIQGDDLEPAAWLALTLAGEGRINDKSDLSAFATRSLEHNLSSTAFALLAMACKTAGMDDLAVRCWRKSINWAEPLSTAECALRLRTQTAFGAPLNICYASADQLLGLRHGSEWENTRATSAAIEALAELLPFSLESHAPDKLTIKCGSKTIWELRDAARLSKAVMGVKLDRDLIPAGDALIFDVETGSNEMMEYSVNATGTQHLDKVEPIGNEIRMRRTYSGVDSHPIPVASDGATSLKAGDYFAVHIQIDLTKAQQYLLVEDFIPAGCEFGSDILQGPDAGLTANVEFRDDRVCAFFTQLGAGHHELIYYLHTENPGLSHVLPGRAYPMYSDQNRGETGAAVIEVKR